MFALSNIQSCYVSVGFDNEIPECLDFKTSALNHWLNNSTC
jgi:hypothetical protein